MDNRPIGIFDSGVGGLTVTGRVLQVMPNEEIVYFGDTARVPYGSKGKETITRFSCQDVRFLLSKNVKAVIVACNTASSNSLEQLRESFDVPVFGTVIPGAAEAAKKTKNKKVGIIATAATVRSGAYEKEIKKADSQIEVYAKACPLFVPLAEEGWVDDEITYLTAKRYIEPLLEKGVDTIILGCTHYPLLRSRIREYMGERIQIVNPAYETAMDLKRVLAEYDMSNRGEDETEDEPLYGHYEFYVSDMAEKFRTFANTVMPFHVPETNVVNIEEY